MACHHVFALHDAKEKWQGAPLLESGRKPPSRWWSGGPAADALSWRDQRQSARGLAEVDRGLRRWPQRSADGGTLCRRANGTDRRRASHSSPTQRLRSAQRSPMGWVLAGLLALRSTQAGPVLG